MRNSLFLVAVLGLASIAFAAACGDDDGGGGGDAGPRADSGPAPDGGPPPGEDGGAEGERRGSVLVNQSVFMFGPKPFYSHSELASFYDYGARPGAGCTTETMGSCEVQSCTFPGTRGMMGMPFPSQDAGDVTISGGTGADVVLSYDAAMMRYADGLGMELRWMAGDMVTISGAGTAEIPAFMGTLTFPGSITVTAPVPAGPRLDIDKSEPLAVAWTSDAGTMGDVSVLVTQSTTTGDDEATVSITCIFPVAGGMGTVPAAALGELETRTDPKDGMTPSSTLLLITTRSGSQVMAGSYPVDLEVSGTGTIAEANVVD